MLDEKAVTSLDSSIKEPAAATPSLTGQAPALIRGEVKQPGAETLTFTGFAPVLGPYEGELALAGATPSMDLSLGVAVTALTLASDAVEANLNYVRAELSSAGSLALASGGGPTLTVSSLFERASDSRFVSLTVDYRIEHIGLAYDTVL